MEIAKLINELTNLHIGEERQSTTVENVKNNISFTGSNLWILACAILIASVGLNINSTAVIIGAMLISPLMGPIVGSGFALGMYDFDLLRKSINNLITATIASLLVSSIYFYLSPFKQAQSELLARTSPNIYDILIAFAGGLAGAIAITRVEKGNPIPGVAIATALMPPLCTAGYGLATANYKFFFGAFFLYTINCVFICLSTFVIVKFLKYPPVKIVNESLKKRIRVIISLLTTLLVLPSSYFAYILYKEQTFKINAENFIEKEFHNKNLIYIKTKYSPNNKIIELAFLNYKADSADIKEYKQKLIDFGLENTTLKFIEKPKEAENETNQINTIIAEKNKVINQLETRIQSEKFNSQKILSEVTPFIPEINSVSISKIKVASDSTHNDKILFYYSSNENLSNEKIEKLRSFLLARLETSEILITSSNLTNKK
jgi:uncharacterized hydrophobic protein (TIGR00271 family)